MHTLASGKNMISLCGNGELQWVVMAAEKDEWLSW